MRFSAEGCRGYDVTGGVATREINAAAQSVTKRDERTSQRSQTVLYIGDESARSSRAHVCASEILLSARAKRTPCR